MKEVIKSFYESIKNLYSEILRTRTETISTQNFKETAVSIYETWKTEIEPMLKTLEIESDVLSDLDTSLEHVYEYAKMRVANVSAVRLALGDISDIFIKRILVSLREEQPSEPTADLMESASFLGLDANWSSATCALQLQEVAVTLVARRKNIKLDKANVEKLLSKRIGVFSFSDQYEAFCKQVKTRFNIEMPILTTHLRRMRVKVLHEGYNPKPEETEFIVGFTIGLLQKLNSISKATQKN